MGSKAYGVSAGFGEIHFTLRSNSNKNMDKIEADLVKLTNEIAHKHKLIPEISWTQQFRANENNIQAVELIKNAAKTNHFDLVEKKTPFG